MIDQIKDGILKLAEVDRMRTMIGQALTPNQQMSISARIGQDPDAFSKFIKTDEGRVALRQLADVFISADLK